MMTAPRETLNKIELHYFFDDESHSMNALIRNKCEMNLLGILKEISTVLNARMKVETEAYTEGGLVERFVLLSKSEVLRSFAALAFHYILPLEVDIEKAVSEENKNELKQRMDKLRRELREREQDEDAKVDMQNFAAIMRSNLKIIKLKSNYYRQLSNCEKVNKLTVQPINAVDALAGKPSIVIRKRFDTHMLVADTLKPETDEKAIIEIVSPVLKTGSYKWKGIYVQNGKMINFAMKDNDFKNQVISESISFKNGTRIECTMESTRKMNEFGETVVTGYSVLTVANKQDGDVTVETPHVKVQRKKKEVELQQLDLFSMFN
jgi:hypothetical protein